HAEPRVRQPGEDAYRDSIRGRRAADARRMGVQASHRGRQQGPRPRDLQRRKALYRRWQAFFFSSRRRHTRSKRDWSSDVCSSDLEGNLWIGTAFGGLKRMQPRHILAYSSREGLANNNAWSICESRRGGLWIGTDSG